MARMTTLLWAAALGLLVAGPALAQKERPGQVVQPAPRAQPAADPKAEIGVARAKMDEWDERGRDEGANRVARQRALDAMASYYHRYKDHPGAAQHVVMAAYCVAKMHTADGNRQHADWYKKTISAFARWESLAPSKDGVNAAVSSAEAAMAAEAEYRLLDQQIRDQFDYETGHHRYSGTTTDVIKAYRGAASDAKKYHDQLQHVVEAYGSVVWAVAARSRQGSLYDSMRTGLYNARPPSLKLFSDKEEKILKKLEESDNPAHQDKADQFRQNRIETWRNTRDRELTDADKLMVKRYVEAVALGRRHTIAHPAVDVAVERLAFFTDMLGDDKLREYSRGIPGFTYSDRIFVRSRPGFIIRPKMDLLLRPMPVVPS